VSPRADRAVGVGLIGLGTIGTGVVKVLTRNADVIEQRLGFRLELIRVADLDLDTDRGVDLSGVRFDRDAEGLIADARVDIVVELIGGQDAARRLILGAIQNRKHVVTANKALLAVHGAEIFGKAAAQGVDVAFEASVGGGIPILRSVREGLAANHIEALYGILNGTTNYVLTQMEATGEDFAAVLKRAQDLGYAEADPSFDVDGIDAAHKLTLLASMAFGADLTCDEVPTEGIRGLAPVDFEAAAELGYRIKLLGIAKSHRDEAGESLEVRVHPTLVPRRSLLASVDGAMNAVAVVGDAVGETLFYGPGAGELPTASAVVADLMEIAREIRRGSSRRVAPLSYLPDALVRKPLVPAGQRSGRTYLRFTAVDRPGVLGHLAGVLGDHGIGIESILQKGRGGQSVPVLVFTHPVREAAVRDAIRRIDSLPDVTAPTCQVRIEEGL
jgi:homoserine dehydrogenase